MYLSIVMSSDHHERYRALCKLLGRSMRAQSRILLEGWVDKEEARLKVQQRKAVRGFGIPLSKEGD